MKEDINNRLGFMQGRLSPIVDGLIQAFPCEHWRDEYPLAKTVGLSYMEWTLDYRNIQENPLLSEKGRFEIMQLNLKYQLLVKTLTGDFIMQRPFYKEKGSVRRELLVLIKNVIKAASSVGIQILVVPIVDNGSLASTDEKESLLKGMEELYDDLLENNINIAFESDYPPGELLEFVNLFDSKVFGINYDIGNSASLGYKWQDELSAYGSHILNVHLKDRQLDGGTVPLGSGDADILGVIKSLENSSYKGLYIFQTARAHDDDHVGEIEKNKNYVIDNLS